MQAIVLEYPDINEFQVVINAFDSTQMHRIRYWFDQEEIPQGDEVFHANRTRINIPEKYKGHKIFGQIMVRRSDDVLIWIPFRIIGQ